MKRIKSFMTALAIVLSIFVVNVPKVEAAGISASQRNLYQKVFDYSFYSQAYPDVVASVGNNSQALLDHYINCGAREGRSASEFFNLLAYANRYPDLVAAFGGNFDAYVQYYVTTGAQSAQNASANDAYLTPERAANIITRMNTLIGTCTTVYNPDIPRANNVQLAADHINGTVLQPGQSFSYNKVVGPRTRANGFVDAPIYIAGKHGIGIGGGICQVSSTLYTAMCNGQINATERHEHSLPVSYLPAGYDATISGDYYDLKFTNTFSQPILISSVAKDGYLTITLIALSN